MELHNAVIDNKYDLVLKLLEENYDPFEKIPNLSFPSEMIPTFGEPIIEDSEFFFESPISAISLASRCGYKDILQLMLDFSKQKTDHKENNACVCMLCDPGPLHLCALGGWVECAEILIKNGWEANQKDEYLWTPLQVAAYKGQISIVRHLMNNHPCSINKADYENAVFIAAELDNCEVCNHLLSGCDISCNLIHSALKIACSYHNSKTVASLVPNFINKTKDCSEYYKIIADDIHNVRKAGDIFQIFADNGALMPTNIAKHGECFNVKSNGNIPKLGIMAMDELLKQNIDKNLITYLEKHLLVKSYYNCNHCQRRIPGRSFDKNSVSFKYNNSEENFVVTYYTCHSCIKKL